MLEELRLVVARWKLGQLRGEELPAIAVRALEAGFESAALAQLALMRQPTLRDAEPHLREALRDLGIREPDRHAAGMWLARYFAARIDSGELTPYEGARRIWQDVAAVIGSPESLHPFVSAASEIEDYRLVRPGAPAEYDRRIAECEAEIRVRAKALLDAASS